MNEPLVSIIVPTYNRAALVPETLESIRRQTYQRIELLVIDDGSTDDTVAVVTEWVERHKDRFTSAVVHPLGENKGKSEAVNYGFDHFTGRYVMVFDSDDVLIEDAIEKQVAYFREHPDVDCLCAGAYLMHGSTRTTEQFHPYRGLGNIDDLNRHHGDFFLKGNPIISSTVLMKRHVVKETGLLEPLLRITHDWEYWIRVTEKFTFALLNEPVMYYRANADGSISQNKLKLFLEVMTVCSLFGGRYSRFVLMRSVLYQIKYHLWLAKNDGAWDQASKIAYYGVKYFFRFLLRWRKP